MKKQIIRLMMYILGITILYQVMNYFKVERIPDIYLGFTSAWLIDDFFDYIIGGKNGRDITVDKEHGNRNSRDN